MNSDATDLDIPFRTEHFHNSVLEFRDAVEGLCRAAEELQGAAIYYDDPITGAPRTIGFEDVFDLSVEIAIKPTHRHRLYCDRCGQEVDIDDE